MRVATQESQGVMKFKNNDLKIKIQDHRRANNESKKFSRTRLQVSRRVHLNDHPLGLTSDHDLTHWFCSKLVAGSESRPPMLNKENYVSWSSRLLR
nr:hypothetical protein [Tanacetum cinerariifolium]